MSGSPLCPRIAVVGAGWWATQFLMPALKTYDGAELAAVVDSNPERLAAASEAFQVARSFLSVDELLNDDAVDGVIIATPNVSHFGIARAVLSSGAHVMVEKPLTLRARDAWELVRLADQQHLHLQLGYTQQFTEPARRLQEVLLARGVGEVRQISGVYSSAAEFFYRGEPDKYNDVYHFPVTPPQPASYADPAVSGGGQGQLQLTHLTGMVLWATGLRASEVSAFMENEGLLVDVFDAIAFRLENAAIGTIGGSGNIGPGEQCHQRVHYFGTSGYAVQDLAARSAEVHYYGNGKVDHWVAAPTGGDHRFATARGFADLIAGRVATWRPGKQVPVPLSFSKPPTCQPPPAGK